MTCNTAPQLPVNTQVAGSCNGVYGSSDCTLLCKAGFTGSGTYTCTADGTWEGNVACSPCASGKFTSAPGLSVCQPWLQCQLGATYQTTAPSSTSNRVCKPVKTCGTGQFQQRAPTLTSDRQCITYTTCLTGQYETVSATATSNRQCSTCSTCATDSIAQAGTCTGTRDTVCVPCSTCASFQYLTATCVGAIDTTCDDVTVCPVGYPQAVPPTSTTNRVCSNTLATASQTPPAGVVYVIATVTIAGFPTNSDITVLAVFTSAVQWQLRVFGPVGVTVLSIQLSTRRAAGTTLQYRVEVPSAAVPSTASLLAAVGDVKTLDSAIALLGSQITGGSDFAKSSTAFPSSPALPGSSHNGGGGGGGGGKTGASASSSNNTLIIAVVCGVVGGVLVIAVLVLLASRRTSRGVDLNQTASNGARHRVNDKMYVNAKGECVARAVATRVTGVAGRSWSSARCRPCPRPAARARPRSSVPSSSATTPRSPARRSIHFTHVTHPPEHGRRTAQAA